MLFLNITYSFHPFPLIQFAFTFNPNSKLFHPPPLKLKNFFFGISRCIFNFNGFFCTLFMWNSKMPIKNSFGFALQKRKTDTALLLCLKKDEESDKFPLRFVANIYAKHKFGAHCDIFHLFCFCVVGSALYYRDAKLSAGCRSLQLFPLWTSDDNWISDKLKKTAVLHCVLLEKKISVSFSPLHWWCEIVTLAPNISTACV